MTYRSQATFDDLVIYHADLRASVCWMASATFAKIGGLMFEAAVKALLVKYIRDEVCKEALKVLSNKA